MSVVRLEQWLVDYTDTDDGYIAPEAKHRSLVGTIYGHPRRPDGDKIRTSRIVNVDGRRVTTGSGTVYELGEVHPEYLKWMVRSGYVYDEDAPIRVIR